MISTFSIAVTLLILIPTVPLVLYAIGLLLPSNHIVSRSTKYNTTPEILWAILTSVKDYPAWRSNIEEVSVRSDEFENDLNKYDDDDRLTFVEYSKKDRRTVVMHIEQEHERKLLRVLEERSSYITPGEEAPAKKSTFSGSWTFLIEPVEGERAVTLKITEQGVINKPMVRVSHMLLFGYHRRIDRFIKDLGKEIDLGILDTDIEEEQQKALENDQTILEEDEEVEEEEEEEQREEQEVAATAITTSAPEEFQSRPDDSMMQTSKPTESTLLTESGLLTESKILDKEWYMLDEDYEK